MASQRERIGSQFLLAVGLELQRTRLRAIATLVGSQAVIAGARQAVDDAGPHKRKLGESVQEKYRFTGAGLERVEREGSDADLPVCDHRHPLLLRRSISRSAQ